jgi:hypothetical protein
VPIVRLPSSAPALAGPRSPIAQTIIFMSRAGILPLCSDRGEMKKVEILSQLLSRIGVVSIKQIITELFLDTLSKGLWLIVSMIVLLFAALVWLNSATAGWFVSLSLLVSCLAVLLFVEFAHDLYRHVNEEVDFVEKMGT